MVSSFHGQNKITTKFNFIMNNIIGIHLLVFYGYSETIPSIIIIIVNASFVR